MENYANRRTKKSIESISWSSSKSNKTKWPTRRKITYNRLKNMGYSSIDSKKFIAQCVAVEFLNIVKFKQEYNLERYFKKNLPKEPFDDE